jgi:hypothetical protein
MNTSFHEKSVWIQLVGVLLALGAYFVLAGMMLAAGQRAMPAYTALFLVASGFLTIVLIAGHAAAAIISKPEASDERDRLIAWRAEHHTSWIVAAGVLSGVACMTMGVNNVWTANILLLSLFLSQILAFTLQLRSYRRGV